MGRFEIPSYFVAPRVPVVRSSVTDRRTHISQIVSVIFFTFVPALLTMRARTISLDSIDGIMVYTLPRMVVLGRTQLLLQKDSPRVLVGP